MEVRKEHRMNNKCVVFGAFLLGSLCVSLFAGEVPEPRPVKSAVEITAIYYPGTDRMAEWNMVEQTRPQIKPLLGWYDEGNPEAIDWQIKWAVEHGISSFCVDWYWCRGVQRFDHWVTGYYKARHRRYLKWYMNWCNHNDPGAHSTSDQIAVTKWWIDNFFKTPEYYKDETGRPLVVLWEWRNLDRDFIAEAAKRGETLAEGEGLKYSLDLSVRLAREAGLPGIRFAAFANDGRPDEKTEALLRKAGIEEFFQYVFAWPWMVRCSLPPARQATFTARKHPFTYTYDYVRDASPGWWKRVWKPGAVPYWPTLSTGWDSTPRQFELASKVTNRTVEDFAEICRSARTFCESNGVKRVVLGPVNEWQEGSYIEPNVEYGFGMYDALREVFCEKPAEGWPKNIVPSDVGLGPYDFPPLERPARTAWDFDNGGDTQGWYRNPYGAQTIRAHDGVLEFFRTFEHNSRASIRSRPTPFAAAPFKAFEVRMRLHPAANGKNNPKGDECVRIIWGTPELPIFDKTNTIQMKSSAATPTKIDGEWHVYRIPVAENPLWKGMVNELWFDPSDLQHVTAEIDWMRFTP